MNSRQYSEESPRDLLSTRLHQAIVIADLIATHRGDTSRSYTIGETAGIMLDYLDDIADVLERVEIVWSGE